MYNEEKGLPNRDERTVKINPKIPILLK